MQFFIAAIISKRMLILRNNIILSALAARSPVMGSHIIDWRSPLIASGFSKPEVTELSGRRRRTTFSCRPLSVSHTARADFAHAAFTKTQDVRM